MVTAVVAATPEVEMMKLPVLDPAATVTINGNSALVELVDKVTTVPPVGAGPLRVTVPADELPPTILDGITETPVNTATAIVRVAVWATPNVPVMEAVTVLPTADV